MRKGWRKKKEKCSVSACTQLAVARTWCQKHWQRWSVGRDPHEKSVFEKTDAERFWEKVDRRGENECWPWKGGTKGRGKEKYGSAWFQGRNDLAHRVAWLLTHKKLPNMKDCDYRGPCVLHSCDFGLCCNPKHLFLGTHKHNMEDKVAKRRDTSKYKKYCKHGHRRTQANLYTSKQGLRACRTCHRIRESQRRIPRYKEQRTF